MSWKPKYQTAKELLQLLGVTHKTWNDLSYYEQLKYIEAGGLYTADFAIAGLLGYSEEVWRKGKDKARADYYKDRDTLKRTREYYDRIHNMDKYFLEWAEDMKVPPGKKNREYFEEKVTKDWDFHPKRRKIEIYKTNKRLRKEDYKGFQGRQGDDDDWTGGFQESKDDHGPLIYNTEQPTPAPVLEPELTPEWQGPLPQENNGMLNPLQKYRATRTSTKIHQNRRASKYAELRYAIQQFWRTRFPSLTMRTYMPAGGANGLIGATSAMQALVPGPGSFDFASALGREYWEFPTTDWCSKVLRKMHLDMTHHSNNGDGEYHWPTNDMAMVSANMKRNGLSLMDQTRTYTIMNPSNVMGFLEIYEFVWNGEEVMENFVNGGPTNPNDVTYYHPAALWAADMNADNPDWGTSVTEAWLAPDKNITVTEPGVRPNGKCKTLWKYWTLEKTTKYCIGSGQTLMHTVHLPAMYISADELYRRSTGNLLIN